MPSLKLIFFFQEDRVKHLSRHLQMTHSNARKYVKDLPEAEQACFISSFLSWAKLTAQDPLNLNFQKKGRKNRSDVVAK